MGEGKGEFLQVGNVTGLFTHNYNSFTFMNLTKDCCGLVRTPCFCKLDGDTVLLACWDYLDAKGKRAWGSSESARRT